MVVLLVAAFGYWMGGSLAVTLANALGKAEHHRATVTAVEKNWHGGLTCRENSGQKSYKISLRWQDQAGPREGSYSTCLERRQYEYTVGGSENVITDPWFGAVGKSTGSFWSWAALILIAFVVLLLAPIGIWQYVLALRAAKDPDPRVRG